jgi:NTE family protein
MAKIGLALAGGGARGAYQIGAWKAFKETGLDKCISAYSGASVGSLNAALFAADDYDTAHKMWMRLNKKSLFNIDKKIYKRVFKEKLKFLDKGVFDTKDLEDLIEEALDYDKVREKDVFVATTHLGNEKSTFFDLLRTNYKHYFKSEKQTKYQNLNVLNDEDIKKTLLASCAIPIVFRPIEIGNETFYDGGLLDNTPYQPLVDIGCDIIIVIDLFKLSFVKKQSAEGVKLITVHPRRSLRGILDFNNKYIERRFELGYKDTLAMIEKHKDILC